MNPLVLFALHRLTCLKLEEKLKLLELFQNVNAFSGLTRFEAEWILGRKLNCRSFQPLKMLALASEDARNLEKGGIDFVSYTDPMYPSLLKEIYDPPLALFWKGTLPPEKNRSLGIVGTRKPSLSAEQSAFILGLDAARMEIPVISGLAAGVDGAAHKGALAIKGHTWAVLGTGCDILYPPQHHRMAEDIIAKGGGILSEFFPGTGPVRYNFPKRNRIISGLSTHVIVIQAPRRSGALYTADYALEQGREVLVHKNGMAGVRSEGTRALAEQGAQVANALSDIFPDTGHPWEQNRKGFWDKENSLKEPEALVWKLARKSLDETRPFCDERIYTYG